jgi:hypothetical protein
VRVFENAALRMLLGPKGNEVTGEWKRLYNGELYCLSSSSNMRVIKSRIMRWAGHVARMGDTRGEYSVLWGDL